MPNKKAQSSALENFFVSEGHRVLYNEITYLKKRIHLVEGERKANYESNEAIVKKNEVAIKEIKEKNKELKLQRKLMADTKGAHFKKIAELIGGEKKAVEFKDKDLREIIDILEYKLGTLQNKINLVDYKRIHYMKDMNEAIQMEGTLRRRLVKKGSHPDVRVEELKATETSTAAMQMKTTEAENVRARYKHMLGVLKMENYTQSVKLSEVEASIDKQQKEILNIRNVLQEANKARKAARVHLGEVEEETIHEFSTREQELYEARMKLKIIRDKMESIGGKLSYPKFTIIHRDSSVTDGLFQQMGGKLESEGGKGSLPLIEAVYTELQELTGESDPKLLVDRFEKQRVHAKELEREEQTMKSAVRKGKLRKRFLLDKLGQLQYSGGLTREELDEKAGEINEEMTTTTTERDRLDNQINEHTVMMEQMYTKLMEICQNNDLRLVTTTTNETSLGVKIVAALQHILQKTETNIQDQLATPLLSPLSPLLTARRNTTANDNFIKEEDRLTPRFGSAGDISYGQPELPAGIGSRRPSITDISETSGLGQMEKLNVNGAEGQISSSPMSDSGFQLQLPIPGEDTREGSEKPKQRGYTTRGQESSEEEEAVTRNFVKRQSQILFEAKTRKGRFNPNTAPAPRHRRY